MASVIAAPVIPWPSSAMRSQESGPSNLSSNPTRVAPAVMLLSTRSATAWGKSYPRSRREWTSRLAEGTTRMGLGLTMVTLGISVPALAVAAHGAAATIWPIGCTDRSTQCLKRADDPGSLWTAPDHAPDGHPAIREATFNVDIRSRETSNN